MLVLGHARAYPRRCGEHPDPNPEGDSDVGLPPQVRGTPARAAHRPHRTGLTPAGAGNTASKALRRTTQQGLTPAGAGNT